MYVNIASEEILPQNQSSFQDGLFKKTQDDDVCSCPLAPNLILPRTPLSIS